MTITLNDHDVARARDGSDVIGGIELRFAANWMRVDQALGNLDHDTVRYRWSVDADGQRALFVEVPVRGDVTPDVLVEHRDRVRHALSSSELDLPPVYIHFLDAATSVGTDV